MPTMHDRMKKVFSPCVQVEWKGKLRRLGPHTMADHKILRSVNSPIYFAVTQYDSVLAKVSEMGYCLEVVGEIPPEEGRDTYAEFAAKVDQAIMSLG